MSKEMDTIGIGIVGAGFMGRTYARTVATQVDSASLVAVTGGSRASDLAKEYGIDHCADFETFLGRDDVDIVCIATPHALHGEQALAAARAGKHLLIDKPMACTVEECDAILEACKDRPKTPKPHQNEMSIQ